MRRTGRHAACLTREEYLLYKEVQKASFCSERDVRRRHVLLLCAAKARASARRIAAYSVLVFLGNQVWDARVPAMHSLRRVLYPIS